MSNIIDPRNLVLAFAFVGFAGIGMSGITGQASAGILDECHAGSKTKVVACCKQHVERFGRPTWMSNGEDNNCRASAVKCVGKKSSPLFAAVAVVAKKPFCYLDVAIASDDDTGLKSLPPANKAPGVAGKN